MGFAFCSCGVSGCTWEVFKRCVWGGTGLRTLLAVPMLVLLFTIDNEHLFALLWGLDSLRCFLWVLIESNIFSGKLRGLVRASSRHLEGTQSQISTCCVDIGNCSSHGLGYLLCVLLISMHCLAYSRKFLTL